MTELEILKALVKIADDDLEAKGYGKGLHTYYYASTFAPHVARWIAEKENI